MKACIIFAFLLSLSFGQEVMWNYQKFIEQIKTNLNKSEASTKCKLELSELLTSDDLWNFFDATSKFPWSGLATSRKSDLGNYDQCININHNYSSGKILGKYCYSGIILNNTYFLALCMPSGCIASDYESIFNITVFNDQLCQTVEYLTSFTLGEILMIALLIIFAMVIFVSTIYDVYLYKTQNSCPHPIYITFSMFTNGRKLLDTSNCNNEQIQIFNGIKTISMMLIIANHVKNAIYFFYIVTNIDSLTNSFEKLEAIYIFMALLSVDSFFYMSGFLQAYNYIKNKKKPIQTLIKNVPYQIFHRYIRLTPAVAMTFLFYITLFKRISFGPHIIYDKEIKDCRTNWWALFLYIQNYYNPNNVCLGPTWYLSTDMQLFVLSPIMLIPMAFLLSKNNNLKRVMAIQFIFNIFATLMPIAIKFWTTKKDYFDFGTHYRIISYTMGITMGIFIREAGNQPFLNGIKRKSIVNLIIWTIVIAIVITTPLLFQKFSFNGHSDNTRSVSHSLLRPIWCLALSWMVYSSYHGYGGIINWILTLPTIKITAKLSYSMYLLHWLVIVQHSSSERTKFWFTEYEIFLNWCGIFIVTAILAIIWSLCFEYPILFIEKLLFGAEIIEKPKVKEIYNGLI